MINLIFGEQKYFSINVSGDGHFSKISISCESEEIGNNDEHTLLYTFTNLLRDKINNYDYLLVHTINHLDKEAIYSYVVDGFEKSENWRESQRLASVWITLDLTPCFDGEVFILLSTSEYDRVVWREFNLGAIRETFLPAGYVLKQLNLLLNYFSH